MFERFWSECSEKMNSPSVDSLMRKSKRLSPEKPVTELGYTAQAILTEDPVAEVEELQAWAAETILTEDMIAETNELQALTAESMLAQATFVVLEKFQARQVIVESENTQINNVMLL